MGHGSECGDTWIEWMVREEEIVRAGFRYRERGPHETETDLGHCNISEIWTGFLQDCDGRATAIFPSCFVARD